MSKRFLVDSEERVYGDDYSKVMVVYNSNGIPIHEGNILLKHYLSYRKMEGFTIKEMTIEEYRQSKITLYEKPQ